MIEAVAAASSVAAAATAKVAAAKVAAAAAPAATKTTEHIIPHNIINNELPFHHCSYLVFLLIVDFAVGIKLVIG